MKKIFRPVEFWKSAIMTLPDDSFFELLRSVFGKIKTPFNKQILMENLTGFLQQPEIKRNIAAYIDPDAAKIIAAVAALHEPAPGELESFFSGELSYTQLNELVVNLEERFILYRFWEEGPGHLALNPVLESILAPFTAQTALLFPSAARDGKEPLPSLPASDSEKNTSTSHPAFDDRILAGLLSFVSEEKNLFKAEGELRKKISDLGGSVFPGLDLQTLIGGLQVLGIFRPAGDTLLPDLERVCGFGKISAEERMEYLSAGIYCFMKEPLPPADISPHLYRVRVNALGSFIHLFINTLETGRLYPQKTIKRIAGVLGRDHLPGEEINTAALVSAMEKTGLLVEHSSGYWTPGQPVINSREVKSYEKIPDAPFIAMDTPFSCVVYPEISYQDMINLTLMVNVRNADTTIRFELTRDSAIRAFDIGLSAQTMIDLLKRLSGGRIDSSMTWTLQDWEKQYGEVSLFKGLVLCLHPERHYLAKTEPLSGLIRKTLAPGVYLLNETAEWEAEKVLRKAGVDIIAGSTRADSAAATGGGTIERTGENFYDTFPSLVSASPAVRGGGLFSFDSFAVSASAPAKETLPRASDLIEGFHSVLEKMHFPREKRDELSARIDRRLVLCETQLKDAAVRYEKLEARGLDYVGKALILKQAISLKSPVELLWSAPAGGAAGKRGNAATVKPGEDRIIGIPLALEKSGGESVLIIALLEKHEDRNTGSSRAEDLRIPLGKISLIRRIKKSIFEQ